MRRRSRRRRRGRGERRGNGVERGTEAEEAELAAYERMMAERRATAEERNADFFERAEDVLEETGEADAVVLANDLVDDAGTRRTLCRGFRLLAFFFFNFNGRFVQFRSRREHVIES